jgi:hypothetical protein
MGAGRRWTVLMISLLSNSFEIDAGDAEVGVPELALDDHQRHALARHLHRVRMP